MVWLELLYSVGLLVTLWAALKLYGMLRWRVEMNG